MSELEVESSTAIEIYVNTGSSEEDAAVGELLESLDAEGLIKHTLEAVNVSRPVLITLMVTSDEEVQALNRQYRQQDKPTDVLSFPLLDSPLVDAPSELLWESLEAEQVEVDLPRVTRPLFVTPVELPTNLGDIVISWPTTQIQAGVAGHSAGDELLFLLCHGVLHLVGYDDQTEAGYQEMVRLQKEILVPADRKE